MTYLVLSLILEVSISGTSSDKLDVDIILILEERSIVKSTKHIYANCNQDHKSVAL